LIHRVKSLGLPVTAVVARRVKGRHRRSRNAGRRPEHRAVLNGSGTNGSLPLRSSTSANARPLLTRGATLSPPDRARAVPRFATTAASPGRFGSLAFSRRPLLFDQMSSERSRRCI
jgi:hypothetical protein